MGEATSARVIKTQGSDWEWNEEFERRTGYAYGLIMIQPAASGRRPRASDGHTPASVNGAALFPHDHATCEADLR